MDYTKIDLDKRVNDLALAYMGRLGREAPSSPFTAYRDAIRGRLQDAVESLRLLKEMIVAVRTNVNACRYRGSADEEGEEFLRTAQAHIDHLHALLGINDTNDNGN